VDRSWEYIKRSQTHECENTGTEAAQFPEKEYVNEIFFAVRLTNKIIPDPIWFSGGTIIYSFTPEAIRHEREISNAGR
jgi:hypothetical protein